MRSLRRPGPWLLPLAAGLAGWLAERNYRALPPLSPAAQSRGRQVSIIIPARNEADRLPELLSSLQRLDYPNYDVTVVDDDSDDATYLIATSFNVNVIRASTLPEGWTGKAHACHVGALSANGEWLLFTDADTLHSPESLSAAIAAAERTDAALLSLMLGQRCETFWERVLLPYAYFLYFVGAARINLPGGPAIANGQYILCRADSYRTWGGHAAVRDSLVEDVVLARRALEAGDRVVLLRGEDLVQVRMYESFAALWEGFSKNSFRFILESPRSGAVTAVAGLVFAGSGGAAALTRSPSARIISLLAPIAALARWYRRFGVPRSYAALFPLSALILQSLAFNSIANTLLADRTSWKGRRY